MTERYKSIEVMHLEFVNDATVEMHEPATPRKGSDAFVSFNNDGGTNCKKEQPMVVDNVEFGTEVVNISEAIIKSNT